MSPPDESGHTTLFLKAYCSSEYDDAVTHARWAVSPNQLARLLDTRQLLLDLQRERKDIRELVLWGEVEFGDLGVTEESDRDVPEDELFTLPEGQVIFDEARTECDTTLVGNYGPGFEALGKHNDSRYSASLSWWDVEDLAAQHPLDGKWGETVRVLAAGILADDAPDRLPILADALEESGDVPSWALAWMRTDNPGRAKALLKTPLFAALAGGSPLASGASHEG